MHLSQPHSIEAQQIRLSSLRNQFPIPRHCVLRSSLRKLIKNIKFHRTIRLLIEASPHQQAALLSWNLWMSIQFTRRLFNVSSTAPIAYTQNMTELLEKAFKKISEELPEFEQDAFAQWLLKLIEDDER